MKYLPFILRTWISLYKEVGTFSKIILIIITLFTLIGFATLVKGWPETLYAIAPVCIAYELSKFGKV